MGKIESSGRHRFRVVRRWPAWRASLPARRCCTRSSIRVRSLPTGARPGSTRCSRAFDFEPVMFANVPQAVYDYTAHGDGGEWNLRRNRQAFDWVDLIPGKAVDPATVDLSSQLLDLKLKYPIMIAPTATQVALHPDGEAGMYRAAQLSSNTPMCLSNNSSQSVEQVAKGAQGQLWWQFYPRQDLGASQELLERAQGAGYTAMVITVDQQASYYERSQHDRNLGGAWRWRPRRRWTRGRSGCGASGWCRPRERSRGTRNGDDRPRRRGAWLGWRGDRAGVHGPPWSSRVPRWRGPPLVHLGIPRPGEEIHQDPHHHQGHRDRRGRAPLCRARIRRHRRVQSRRPIDGLRSRRRSKRCPRLSRP